MPTVTMTAMWLERIRADAGRVEFHDAKVHGLALRVSPTGAKAWSVLYRLRGDAGRRKRRLTLGAYPALGLLEARSRAREALLAAARGQDPAGEKQTLRKAPTLTVVAGEYMTWWAKPRKRSWREDQRMLDRYVLPTLGARIMQEIKRRDIIALLDPIVAEAPIQANRVLALVRKVFNFAISRGILELSPCVAIKAPAPETPRARVLSDEELAAFVAGLPMAPMSGVMQSVLWMILLSAQRPSEVATLRWEDIDGDWWTIPRWRSKNSRAQRVPITAPMAEVLKRLSRDSAYVFPSPRIPRGGEPVHGLYPMTTTAPSHALRRASNLPPCTPHDLRRTAATHLAELGFSEEIIDAVLNHKRAGVTARHYNLYRYDKEKRQALDAWAAKLLALKPPSAGA